MRLREDVDGQDIRGPATVTFEVTSKMPRVNAPLMVPTWWPLTQTSAM